jgi:hypothetical protein
MLFDRKQTCSKCGTINPPNANYCIKCNTPLSAGSKKCGFCGQINAADAIYCQECGQRLEEGEAPLIINNRWRTLEKEFAVRVDTDDLPGLLKKGIIVEPGTNAILLENGVNVGVVPPGSYLLDSFSQRFGNLFRSGLPKTLTALLVRITPTDLDFPLERLFSKDPFRVNLLVKLQVEVQEPAKFLINMLRGRERMNVETLREYLQPEVQAVADKWVRTYTIEELAEDFSLRPKLELALEEALRQSFSQAGLRFLQVRALDMNLEVLDIVNNKKSEYALQIAQTDAELQGKKTLLSVKNEMDLMTLKEETAQFELEERKMDLYQRMRHAVNSDKMNEVRSETELKNFLREIDRAEVLDKKEYEDLLRSWREGAEDHDLARAFLIKKLEMEQQYQVDKLRIEQVSLLELQSLKSQKDLDAFELERDLNLAAAKRDYNLEEARKIAFSTFELEKEQFKHDLDRQKLTLEKQKLIEEQNLLQADTALGIAEKANELTLKIWGNKKALDRLDEEERRRIIRDDELQRQKIAFEQEMQRFENEERRKGAEREHEITKLHEIGALSSEQLISISPVDQAKILADLKRTEALRSMTEEQILALAAERNPEVAKAIQERYQAIAEGKTSAQEKELYERLLGEQKGFLDEIKDISTERIGDLDRANQRAQEIQKHAMDALAATAQAFANNKSAPTVILGDSGSRTIYSDGSQLSSEGPLATKKVCVSCGRQIDINFKNCPHCGHKFSDLT